MADNYTFPGPLNSYTAQTQANIVVEYARNASRFKLLNYVNVRPVDYMYGFYRKLKNEQVARIVDVSRFSWSDGADNPALGGEWNNEPFEFLSYQCQRYSVPAKLGYQTVDQAQRSGYDILGDTANLKASQAMLLRTKRCLDFMTTAGNWPAANTGTATAQGGGQFTSATSTNPYIRQSFMACVNTIVQNTNGMAQPGDIVAVISPAMAKTIAQSGEFVDFVKQQPGVYNIWSGSGEWNGSSYWLPADCFGCKVIVEDAVIITTEQGISPNRAFVMPATQVLFLTKKQGLTPQSGGAISTFEVLAYQDFKLEVTDDVINKRHLVNVNDVTAEVGIALESGYLLTAAA